MLHPDHIVADPTLSTRARRAEIDDFLRLLEVARAQAAADTPFTLALLAPRRAPVEAGGSECCRAADLHAGGREADVLAEAHDFLALNLRRRDEVAFYGPTLLAALLPAGRGRRAADDLARLLAEFHGAHAHLSVGLASFPDDGADIEALVVCAEAALDATLAADDKAGEPLARESTDTEPVARESSAGFKEDGRGTKAGDDGARAAAGRARPAQKFLPLDETGARSSAEWRTGSREQQEQSSRASSKRGLPAAISQRRALRESKRGDDFGSVVLPYGDAPAGGVLVREAAEAAERERARRAGGARLPRRLLLAVSDAARMAQVNLLLRAAGYEVRAAFDGKQTLDLLRIERADLLVLDFALAGVDGLEVLRRLDERHGGRLPLPVVLLVPAERDGEELRAGASRLGAGGFVPLPYDPQELLDCVRTAGGAG
ncbi:MAG: response regulator [Acidobacteria bacterium]|nr:response regulator [Acidobacteriota bacterium]